jgi:K+-sensing histidine kinase KdpD
MSSKQTPSTMQPSVPWENFVKFLRQLSHDLRNQLNAAELQGALVGEITTDPELKSEVARLRELVSKIGTTLQRLTTAVSEPRPTRLSYPARDFVSDLQKKVAQDYPKESQHLTWDAISGDAVLDIDPSLIEWAAIELFDNAFRHSRAPGQIRVSTEMNGNRFSFLVHEPKAKEMEDPWHWSIPLRSIAHGHYNLGLPRARAILEAHGGDLTSEFDSDSSTLTSRITLPCSVEKG